MTQRVLPVTVVTGFLGAGKTTLVRELLAAPHGLQIGLILNEFGQAGIDVVPTSELAFMELPDGCACCVKSPDLVRALTELAQRGDLDRVVVETSGLADPLPLTWTIGKPELADLVRLDAVLTVVDAQNLDRAASEEWEAQVRCADLVAVTKRDLAGEAGVRAAEEAVRRVNPHARLFEPGRELPVGIVLDADVGRPRAHGFEQQAVRHSDFTGHVLSVPGAFVLERLEDRLEDLPGDVFRAKGIVPVTDGSWVAFHCVGGRLQMDFDAPAPPHGEARVAFFGRGLTRERAESLLDGTRA